jgi:hypothetical protein
MAIGLGGERSCSIDEKRYLLLQGELDKLRNQEELDVVKAKVCSGLDIDTAVNEALNVFFSENHGVDIEGEAKKLRDTYFKACEISNLDEAEVERRYLDYRRTKEQAEREAAEELDKIAFFNQPSAAADFLRWNRKKNWYAEDAVALSLGKNPEAVNSKSLKEFGPPNSLFAIEFKRRLEALTRAIEEHHILPPLKPSQFIEWAKVEGFSLPPELDTKLATDKSGEKEDSDYIHPRTLIAFYNFLVGMAIKHYDLDPNYDPQKGDKSPAFESMARDLLSVNAPVTEKTLREHIKKALERARDSSHKFKKPRGRSRAG